MHVTNVNGHTTHHIGNADVWHCALEVAHEVHLARVPAHGVGCQVAIHVEEHLRYQLPHVAVFRIIFAQYLARGDRPSAVRAYVGTGY